jgi:hypothetical protein
MQNLQPPNKKNVNEDYLAIRSERVKREGERGEYD